MGLFLPQDPWKSLRRGLGVSRFISSLLMQARGLPSAVFQPSRLTGNYNPMDSDWERQWSGHKAHYFLTHLIMSLSGFPSTEMLAVFIGTAQVVFTGLTKLGADPRLHYVNRLILPTAEPHCCSPVLLLNQEVR